MLRSPLLIGADGARDGMTRMGIARITVGSMTLVPSLAGRLFGAPREQVTPTARFLARLFGVRQVVLGAWALSVRDADPAAQKRCMQLNLAIDAADLVVILPYLLRRDLRRAALMSTLLAASAVAAWYELLEEG